MNVSCEKNPAPGNSPDPQKAAPQSATHCHCHPQTILTARAGRGVLVPVSCTHDGIRDHRTVHRLLSRAPDVVRVPESGVFDRFAAGTATD